MDETYSERALTHYVGASWRAPLSVRMHPVTGGLAIVLAGPEDCARAWAAAQAAQASWIALPEALRRAELVRMAAALPETEGLRAGFGAGMARPVTLAPPVALINGDGAAMAEFACKIAACLVAGGPVIAVPGLTAPLHAIPLAEAADTAALAPGVFNLLHGSGPDISGFLMGVGLKIRV